MADDRTTWASSSTTRRPTRTSSSPEPRCIGCPMHCSWRSGIVGTGSRLRPSSGIERHELWEKINSAGFTRTPKCPAAKREDVLDAFHRPVGEDKDELLFGGIVRAGKSFLR